MGPARIINFVTFLKQIVYRGCQPSNNDIAFTCNHTHIGLCMLAPTSHTKGYNVTIKVNHSCYIYILLMYVRIIIGEQVSAWRLSMRPVLVQVLFSGWNLRKPLARHTLTFSHSVRYIRTCSLYTAGRVLIKRHCVNTIFMVLLKMC